MQGGYFCLGKGIYEINVNIVVKSLIVEVLLVIGFKIVFCYFQDYSVLGYEKNCWVMIYNDCIFNNGLGGDDGGIFLMEDIEIWFDYFKDVVLGNIYGGEFCNQVEGFGYNWNDFVNVCGDNGLIIYIYEFEVLYLNVSFILYCCFGKFSVDL